VFGVVETGAFESASLEQAELIHVRSEMYLFAEPNRC
jgi:hypothetical protein